MPALSALTGIDHRVGKPVPVNPMRMRNRATSSS
jgi:hypothetical protein